MRHLRTQADAVSAALLLAVWLCYVVGAALGAIAKHRWELKAIYAPVALLAALVILDRLRPLAAAEEQHQSAGPKLTSR